MSTSMHQRISCRYVHTYDLGALDATLVAEGRKEEKADATLSARTIYDFVIDFSSFSHLPFSFSFSLFIASIVILDIFLLCSERRASDIRLELKSQLQELDQTLHSLAITISLPHPRQPWVFQTVQVNPEIQNLVDQISLLPSRTAQHQEEVRNTVQTVTFLSLIMLPVFSGMSSFPCK